MTGIERAQLAVLTIFAINALLLIGLIVLKTVHRRRMESHDRRRIGHVGLLSRHLAYEHCTDPITRTTAEDPAFLDALIDVRNAVVGPEISTLRGIIDRFGVVEHQSARLRSRFSLGRRLRAAVALAEIGDESSAPVLMEHLNDHEPEIRIQCARGLGRMRWTPAIDSILERFTEETPWVRARFADTLVGFGTTATWPLIAYIRVNHPFDNSGPALAIRTLATIGDDAAVAPLIELLDDDPDVEILLATVEALGHLENPMAAPRLQVLCHSEDWRVRAKSASALGEIGDTSSPELLSDLLGDLNWWVRRNSAAALAQIRDGDQYLYKALQDPDPYAADAAAEALADSGALAAARDRQEMGRPTPEDLALMAYMAEVEVAAP